MDARDLMLIPARVMEAGSVDRAWKRWYGFMPRAAFRRLAAEYIS